jgi:hypothetical protein
MVQAAMGKVTEVLAGLVDRVTFHNAENGFCVLRVKARGQRDLITVLGHAAIISAGEFVQASGTWVNDRTHGMQFRASFLKATAPTTVEGIVAWLGRCGGGAARAALTDARHPSDIPAQPLGSPRIARPKGALALLVLE